MQTLRESEGRCVPIHINLAQLSGQCFGGTIKKEERLFSKFEMPDCLLSTHFENMLVLECYVVRSCLAANPKSVLGESGIYRKYRSGTYTNL